MDIKDLKYEPNSSIRMNFTEEARERGPKQTFYASDFQKPALDIYFSFTGEPQTNPPKWSDTLKWGAGLGAEAQMLLILKQNKIVRDDYDQNEERIEIEREGITISGRPDALIRGFNYPIEIKTINNKNSFDIKKYREGYPRENYVGQLGIYMDALGVNEGYLFVASIDGLDYFWMKATRDENNVIRCNNVSVDLNAEYKRWASVYEAFKNEEPPNIWEYRYKYPIQEIDWKKISKGRISKARTGKAVIGDWQVQYSPWKNKIVEMQGDTLGYSDKEMAEIIALTKNYTSW